MPFVLPRSISSFVFFAAAAASPESIAPVACGQTSRGAICSARAARGARDKHASRSVPRRFIQRLFVRWTKASFNSPRCVERKSSSSAVRLPSVFSLSMVTISIICRAAAASICGFG